MKTTEKQIDTFPKLKLIDIDSPFFVGIGYTPSPEEKKELGVEDDDDRPMSILGLTMDEVAGIDYGGAGRRLAQLFVVAPELLESLGVMTQLCKLKYGNLDKDVYAEILKAEAVLAKATGGAR